LGGNDLNKILSLFFNPKSAFPNPKSLKRGYVMSEKLMEYFNKQPRLGTLSTADKNGKVDSAYFGSPRMIDDKTIFMGLGNNRTFANLQDNPQAIFMVMEPGQSIADWKGVRIYVTMTECQTEGNKLDDMRATIAKKMIHAAVTFEIQEIRPLADFGQGWEKSI
jgi:hypothetical protein